MGQGIANMITFIKSGLTTFLKNRKLFNVVGNRKKILTTLNFFDAIGKKSYPLTSNSVLIAEIT